MPADLSFFQPVSIAFYFDACKYRNCFPDHIRRYGHLIESHHVSAFKRIIRLFASFRFRDTVAYKSAIFGFSASAVIAVCPRVRLPCGVIHFGSSQAVAPTSDSPLLLMTSRQRSIDLPSCAAVSSGVSYSAVTSHCARPFAVRLTFILVLLFVSSILFSLSCMFARIITRYDIILFFFILPTAEIQTPAP